VYLLVGGERSFFFCLVKSKKTVVLFVVVGGFFVWVWGLGFVRDNGFVCPAGRAGSGGASLVGGVEGGGAGGCCV